MVETLMVDPVEDLADNLGSFPQAAFDPSVMHEAGSDGFSDARASSSSVFLVAWLSSCQRLLVF